jgi:hypothetical protein
VGVWWGKDSVGKRYVFEQHANYAWRYASGRIWAVVDRKGNVKILEKYSGLFMLFWRSWEFRISGLKTKKGTDIHCSILSES